VVDGQSVGLVERGMKAVASQLLGGQVSAPSSAAEKEAWIGMAMVMGARLQTTAEQCSGRAADMGPEAGRALIAALMAVTGVAPTRGWAGLEKALATAGTGARARAARKLITNRGRVLCDVCNPARKSKDVSTVVPSSSLAYVESGMRAIASNLLGGEARLASDSAEKEAWMGMATVIGARLQTSAEQCSGREPDMDAEAGAALGDALIEVTGVAPTQGWSSLENLLASASGPRAEAARKLITNRGRVLRDICNSARKSQPEITSAVTTSLAGSVQNGMKQVAFRLLGGGIGSPASLAEEETWKIMAAILSARLQTSSAQCSSRVPDMGVEAGAALRGVLVEIRGFKAPGWEQLESQVASASGPGGEAARKLVGNRGAVLIDVCNAGRKTQRHIATAVNGSAAALVENGMKECARRLLGLQATGASSGAEKEAWAGMATVISARLQTSSEQCSGRKADMGLEGGAALRNVLMGMTNMAPTQGWTELERALTSAGSGPSVEAARKLIANRGRVLFDLSNADRKTQLVGGVVPSSPFVEAGMKEVARRLLGGQSSAPSNGAEKEAWIGMATVLDARLQTTGEQCPGRAADMGSDAGVMLRGVLAEIKGAALPTSGWAQLEQSLASAGNSPSDQAARKLITNRGRVLNDVCNPARKSQGALTTAVPLELAGSVEKGMKELARRLLGAPAVSAANNDERDAWVGMASVLGARLQTSAEECSGRAPDMNPEAGAALRSALVAMSRQIASGKVHSSAPPCFSFLSMPAAVGLDWSKLEKACSSGGGAAAGRAAKHSQGARAEAARKLIGNRERILNDVCNPRRSQGAITVVPLGLIGYVENGMKEAASRLIGLGSRTATGAENEAWTGMATVIDGRLQTSSDQCPGRVPDMSPEAGAALRDVMLEMTGMMATSGWGELERALKSVAPGPSAQAAAKLITNRGRVLNDVCNQARKSQTNIEVGVPAYLAGSAESGMKEVARRLLGATARNATSDAEKEAWIGMATVLERRLQTSGAQCSGRAADMAPAAGDALRGVLAEIKGTGMPTSGWAELERTLASAGSGPAVDAARKLIANRGRVLNDCCNPSRKSQPGISTVSGNLSREVENGMKEVANRLLGGQPSLPSSATEREAWFAMASVMDARLQTSTEQKPGRAPDMSPAAGASLRGVLAELKKAPIRSQDGCFAACVIA